VAPSVVAGSVTCPISTRIWPPSKGAPPRRARTRRSTTRRALASGFCWPARTGERVPLDELGGVIDQSALAPLAAAGLVSLAGGTLRVTRKGAVRGKGVCVRLFRDSSFLEA